MNIYACIHLGKEIKGDFSFYYVKFIIIFSIIKADDCVHTVICSCGRGMAYNFTQCHDAARGYAAHLRSTLPYHAPRAHRSIIEKSLKSAVPSSTPHAPRNLVNQHGQPVPKKRQYKILENNVFKSASAPNLLANKDDKQNDIVGKFSTNQKQQPSMTKPSKVRIKTCPVNL